MKKKLSLVSLLLALCLLTACGASAASADAAAGAMAETKDVLYEEAGETEAALPAEEPAMDAGAARSVTTAPGFTEGTVDLSEKIIYSAQAEIETTDFDASVETVYSLMDQYGAFLEASAVNGSNLNTSGAVSTSARSASFILRVPRENYAAMTGALDAVGNVTYLTSSADNITAQYTDTESRLSAYEVEEQRLLDILAQAEDVEDMIALENRLSDIRYQKESLTSQLQNWDTQVSYSSVDLFIREVQVLTPAPEEERTYWQQVGDGFVNTLKAMGRGAKALFRLFVTALPALIPIAAVVALIILLALRKKRRADKAAPPQSEQDKT